MAEKLPPCCARHVGALTRAENDLRILARRAARRPERREHWTRLIAKARAEIATVMAATVDHEAEHAA